MPGAHGGNLNCWESALKKQGPGLSVEIELVFPKLGLSELGTSNKNPQYPVQADSGLQV